MKKPKKIPEKIILSRRIFRQSVKDINEQVKYFSSRRFDKNNPKHRARRMCFIKALNALKGVNARIKKTENAFIQGLVTLLQEDYLMGQFSYMTINFTLLENSKMQVEVIHMYSMLHPKKWSEHIVEKTRIRKSYSTELFPKIIFCIKSYLYREEYAQSKRFVGVFEVFK